MADQPNSLEIEDVLSSIRRLVSQDGARGAMPQATPVAAPVAPPVVAPEPRPEPVFAAPEPTAPAFPEPTFSEPTFSGPVEDLYAEAPDPLEIAARLQPAPMKEEQDALVLGPALRIPEAEPAEYELPVAGAWAEGLGAASLEQPDLGGEHVLAAAFAAPQAPAAPEVADDPFAGEQFAGDDFSADDFSGEPSLSAAAADALSTEEDDLQSWERSAAPAEEHYDPEGFFGSPLLAEPAPEAAAEMHPISAPEPEIEWVDMVSEEPVEEEFIVSSTEYPIDDPEPLTRLTAADLPSAPAYAPRQSSYEALREAEERAAVAAEFAAEPEDAALPEEPEQADAMAGPVTDPVADPMAGSAAGAMVAGAAMEPADLLAGLDEDYLRGLVRAVLREELQGQMGERITRNLRKLVRREIQRALAGEQFD